VAKEIDIRITATPHGGGDPIVSTVRANFPDTAPERGRVASEHVWLTYPEAGFVGYLHGEARFTHPQYDIVAAVIWDSQGPRSATSREKVAAPSLFD
jgi:hypothetical protein